jgi:hypothetical protein
MPALVIGARWSSKPERSRTMPASISTSALDAKVAIAAPVMPWAGMSTVLSATLNRAPAIMIHICAACSRHATIWV